METQGFTFLSGRRVELRKESLQRAQQLLDNDEIDDSSCSSQSQKGTQRKKIEKCLIQVERVFPNVYWLPESEQFINLRSIEHVNKHRSHSDPPAREACKFAGTDVLTGDCYVVALFRDHAQVDIKEGSCYEIDHLTTHGFNINGELKLFSTKLTVLKEEEQKSNPKFPRQHVSFKEIHENGAKLVGYNNVIDTTGKVTEILVQNGTLVKMMDETGTEITLRVLGDLQAFGMDDVVKMGNVIALENVFVIKRTDTPLLFTNVSAITTTDVPKHLESSFAAKELIGIEWNDNFSSGSDPDPVPAKKSKLSP